MQAAPISSPAPSNTASPAAATLLPFDPHTTSPFTAAFQVALKGASNRGNIPAQGKQHDSSRNSGLALPTPNNSAAVFLPVTSVPVVVLNSVEPSLSATHEAAQQLPATIAERDADTTPRALAHAAQRIDFFSSSLGEAPNASQTSAIPLSVSGPENSTLWERAAESDGNTPMSAPVRPNSNAAADFGTSPLDQETIPNFPASDIQDVVPLPSVVPTSTALSTDASEPTNPANTSVALAPDGPEQAMTILQFANPNSIPRDPGLPPQQGQRSPNTSSNGIVGNAAHGSRPEGVSQNVRSSNPAFAGAKVSLAVSAEADLSRAPQSNFQPLPAKLLSIAETVEQSAGGSAAAGVPTSQFRDDLNPPQAAVTPSVPTAATASKSQSQESSNGSAGDESNAKPDRSAAATGPRTNEKGFGQSQDAPAATPAGEHSMAADSAAVAAATPVPAPSSSQSAQPPAASGIHSNSAESLPAATPGTPVVNGAHIVTQPGQTEIRIEMQADSLGGVELRAHIAGDQIGASISVEHHDAQVALALDLPALHNALAEKNLRLESLTVSQGTFSSLSGGLGQDTNQRSFSQPPAKPVDAEPPETSPAYKDIPTELAAPVYSGTGLSVVA